MNTSAQVELTKFTYSDHSNKNHLNIIKYITYYKNNYYIKTTFYIIVRCYYMMLMEKKYRWWTL
jgi:hypothetical protein